MTSISFVIMCLLSISATFTPTGICLAVDLPLNCKTTVVYTLPGVEWRSTVQRVDGVVTNVVLTGCYASSNAERLIIKTGSPGQVHAIVDGVKEKDYDHVGSVLFSADSRRYAYVAERGSKSRVVCDGVADQEYDRMAPEGPRFSPDGLTLTYVGYLSGRSYLVANGKALLAVDGYINTPRFVDDGHTMISVATQTDGKKMVVYNGVPQKTYDDVRWPTLLANQLVYVAKLGDQWLWVQGETETVKPELDKIDGLIVSPDGKNITHLTLKDNGWTTCTNGAEGKLWPGTPLYGMHSSNSGRLAVVAIDGDRTYLIVDDVEVSKATSEWQPSYVFSPDGKRVAYEIAMDSGIRVGVDGVQGKEQYGHVYDMLFSSDGKRFAYEVEVSGKFAVVLDGVKGRDSHAVEMLSFSPDGSRFAYVDDARHVIVDGVESGAYRQVSAFAFSPDSKHAAFIGDTNDREALVVDGAQLRTYDRIYGLVFDGGSRLRFIARDGDSVIKGTVTFEGTK